LALSGDHQNTQPGVGQRVEAREPVGEDPQLAQPLERRDQPVDRWLHRRDPQPLELGHVSAGRDAQQPLKPPALLGGERRGEHRPAALAVAPWLMDKPVRG
jgi:hypothetical protein